MNDDPINDTPPKGTPCPTCAAPHPTHVGWCPRWEWRDDSSQDAPGDAGGATLAEPLDTGLRPDWADPAPEPEPGAPDDFAAQEPDAQYEVGFWGGVVIEPLTQPDDVTDVRIQYVGDHPCPCPPGKYSVARGVCRGCGRVGPPPKCRCVDCLGFRAHVAEESEERRMARLTQELYVQYGLALFAQPAFNRFAYLSVVSLEEVSS